MDIYNTQTYWIYFTQTTYLLGILEKQHIGHTRHFSHNRLIGHIECTRHISYIIYIVQMAIIDTSDMLDIGNIRGIEVLNTCDILVSQD